MKQVLIIDAPLLFRDFLKEKLTLEKVSVDVAQGKRDAFTKLVSILPDLVILDTSGNFLDLIEFLEKKKADPNASLIPVILSGPVLPRELITKLPALRVIKYFNKPVKFDLFFESIGRVLKIPFSIDTTPCILELHLNANIIFIEIAQGLNREKLALLKYKLVEMIDENQLINPKIVLMMTDLSLSFVDGANLEYLFDNVTSDPRILHKNIKVLTLDSFTRDLVAGHIQYDGIQVSESLSSVLNSLVDSSDSTDVADVISDKILTATDNTNEGSVQMRFYSEDGVPEVSDDNQQVDKTSVNIAIVDDDAVIRHMLQATFTQINGKCDLFESGSEFLNATNKKVYDLIILDIFMPGLSGFDILTHLHNKQYPSPIIIYSTATQREAVVQALSLGAKSYLIKPLKPEAIIQKAVEVLNAKV